MKTWFLLLLSGRSLNVEILRKQERLSSWINVYQVEYQAIPCTKSNRGMSSQHMKVLSGIGALKVEIKDIGCAQRHKEHEGNFLSRIGMVRSLR